MRLWVGVENIDIENNKMVIFNTVTSVSSKNIRFSNNTCSWVRFYNYSGAIVTDNTIDYYTIDQSANTRTSAFECYGNTWIKRFSGNHIKHPSIGLLESGGGFHIFALGDNIIKAPTEYSISQTDAQPPSTGTFVTDNLPIGFKCRVAGYGVSNKSYWSWNGTSWLLEGDYGKRYTYNLSFIPTANGLFIASPRTIVGIKPSDNVIIDSPFVSPSTGEYIAKVTANDTLQIYYRNFTSDTTPVNHTVYITILK
ncbi:hypothetical protein ABTD81_17840 [Acinetobacter baumannii]